MDNALNGTASKTLKLSAVFSLVALGGCASISTDISSPLRSTDNTNSALCPSFEEAQVKASGIMVGTLKSEALKTFGVANDDVLRHLTKAEINNTLYGQTHLNIPFEQRYEAQTFLNSLEGLALTCQSIKSDKSFGLTASYTAKEGYDYTVTFVFKGNEAEEKTLHNPVQVSGGRVKQKSSDGYFNGLNPSILLRR